MHNNDLTASDNLKFRFATDGEGNHGYLGADDSFIPFKSGLDFDLCLSTYNTDYMFLTTEFDENCPRCFYFKYDTAYTNSAVGSLITITKTAGYPSGHDFKITYKKACTRYYNGSSQHFSANQSETIPALYNYAFYEYSTLNSTTYFRVIFD